MANWFNDFLTSAQASIYRSTALAPLGWLIALLLTGGLVAFAAGVPNWVGTWLIGSAIGAVILFGVFFIYFAFKDRDALRSEKYNINKMIVERSHVGDSVAGVLEAKVVEDVELVIESSATGELP